MQNELTSEALALYKPPFSYKFGYILDANSNMVADQSTMHDGAMILQIRGWGRLHGKGALGLPREHAAKLQDHIGELCALALTKFWEADA